MNEIAIDQSAGAMRKALGAMRRAHNLDPNPSYAIRRDRLKRLERCLLENADRLVAAISADFSHRSAVESHNFDVTVPIGDVRFARRNLKRWMRVRKVRTPKHLLPAHGRIHPQPLGVVGVISPWNFPVYLTIGPLVTALAAGNRVMIKPSELTPRTSEVLHDMIAATFAPDEVAVFTGGPDVASEFSNLPFDHLLFTGSTAVGRRVALAAANNLTPVTLELGGKSPAVITPSADIDLAARRIAWGKTANAGQICIAPDYALVPRSQLDDFVERFASVVKTFYPQGAESADYTAIISDRHRERLVSMLDEAEESGAKVIRLAEGNVAPGQRKLAPAIVVDPSPSLRLMREEIFGPILPVIPYDTSEEALNFVTERDRPLALYVFARSADHRDFWLSRSISGGVTVNDTLLHVVFDTLPFGGVGPSGIGAYHGDIGFETFSHMKPVLMQARFNAGFLFEPPFDGIKAKFVGLLRKII